MVPGEEGKLGSKKRLLEDKKLLRSERAKSGRR